MSTRNLEFMLRPKSIALIGASAQPHSVGNVVARNLLTAGFDGAIAGVNIHDTRIEGMPVVKSIAQLPFAPELAVVCTPAPTVPTVIAELGQRGAKAAVVITAGLDAALRQQMLDAAKPNLLRIVGPNCLGLMSTAAGVNASFAHLAPHKGKIAFIAQSGAILTTVLDWATSRGLGFSHLVSLGNMADVDFGDMLDYLATDRGTDAIICYAEGVTSARKFMSAARAAARLKPVIAIKAGRNPAAAKAAQSHTGALAGSDAVYDAVFRRAGVLRVHTLDEVFDAVETLGLGYTPHGERLAILTNGGGPGVLATDALLDLGGTLAELAPDTTAKLDAVLPTTWSRGNPIDIIGDAPPARYAAALDVLFDAREVDAVLVLNCPTAVTSSSDAARAVIETCASAKRTVLTNWLGTAAALEARSAFAAARLPTFDTPDEAVRGFMHLVQYRRAQDALMEVPPALAEGVNPDLAKAREIVGEALSAGQSWLDGPSVSALLSAYGIPIARSALAKTPDEVAEICAGMGVVVALKIVSRDILHKSDVGGVALDIQDVWSAREAAVAMSERVAAAAPNARIDGFLVQEMIHRPLAHELILGMTVDPTFGPMLLFGRGGTAVEVIADTTLALPPLNFALARATIARTRVFRELKGYRDRKPADLDAVAATLVELSQLVCDLDEIVELDLNPLLADETGVIAVDARIRVAPVAAGQGKRLAISPYPAALESIATVKGFGEVAMRPVRPEDALAFNRFAEKLTPEDVRFRFFSYFRQLPQRLLARLTQIDYDREMAFVLFSKPQGDVLGIGRLAADPDNVRAEFAVIVRSDLKGRGMGTMLIKRLLAYAREKGLQEVFGDILSENKAMIALVRKLGFEIQGVTGAPDLVRAVVVLKEAA